MDCGDGKRERLSLCGGNSGIAMNRDGEEEEEEELELSLGLSMNGRFGVDPMRKRLKRSSSISNLAFDEGRVEACVPLARTRSLPAEVEEEWRRRKEFQSMRRMAARKKRMEKLRNVRVQQKEISSSNGYEISSSQGSIGSQGSSGISDLDFEGN